MSIGNFLSFASPFIAGFTLSIICYFARLDGLFTLIFILFMTAMIYVGYYLGFHAGRESARSKAYGKGIIRGTELAFESYAKVQSRDK